MRFIRPVVEVAGAALLVLGMWDGAAALAQNYNASEAVSTSSLGTMRCGQFTRLSPSARDRVVRQMVADAPQRSLTTPPSPNLQRRNDQLFEIPHEESATPGTPLDAGQLIAACQAASPGSTLRDAFAQFNSGFNALPPRRR